MSTQSSRRGSRLVAGIGAFVLLCGLVLVLVAGPSAEAPAAGDEGPTLEDRVNRALSEAHSAERALTDANYGEASEHLRRLDRRLNQILDDIDRD